MSSPPPASQPASSAAKLQHSGAVEQARPTAHQDTQSPALTCRSGARASHQPAATGQPPVEPTFHYLGLGFAVSQYGIGHRSMALKLPAYANGGIASATPLQAKAASALPPAAAGAAPSLLTLPAPETPPNAPTRFEATLTSGAGGLKAEPTVLGYQSHPVANAQLNPLLGKTLAIHLQRSGILKPSGHGNFKGSMLGAPQPGLETTEMLGVKLFVFLRARIDGQPQIQEIIDGKPARTVTAAEYERLKLAEPKPYWDAFSGSMPLIPGVYQVHVLLEDPQINSEGAGLIGLVEVHCDGDCLYQSATP